MFLQIHTLTSYHASLLNRDDAGLAKRIPFGGAERLRISSQCLKRHWTEWLRRQVDLPQAVRTRHFFARILKPRLIEEGDLPEEKAHELVLLLARELLKTAGDKDAVDKETLEMKQPALFGKPEADFLLKILLEAAQKEDPKKFLQQTFKEGKKNFRALCQQAGIEDPAVGIEGALFGRFVTSDILARVDAPVHVAHAFTTHRLEAEVDFFTVVDDLAKEEETGAAHAGDMELGAGIFYGYVVVDVPLLVSNLTGCERTKWREQDHESAKILLEKLIEAIATVSPGAKLGATAPYARAEWVCLEWGESQPRSLANAFLKPVPPSMEASVRAAADYLGRLEGMYGDGGETRVVSTCHAWPCEQEPVLPLKEAASRALEGIFQ